MPREGVGDTLGFVLSDTARLMRTAIEEAIGAAGFGITPGDARALMHIGALDEPRQTLIAERMGIEPMTLTGYVDRLEGRGLVRREPDPNDRRAKIVMLTETGQRLAEAIRPVIRQLYSEVTEPLGRDGEERLRKMLVGLRGALQERRDG